jgi:signal peptidase II
VSAPTVAARSKIWLLYPLAAAVLAIDVVTKVLAVAYLEDRPPVPLLGGLVNLVLVRNPGAAWSMATGYTWVLSLIAITVVVVLIRVSRRLRSTGWAIALGLVLGGALGNLVDRIFRSPGPLRGHVVDMVSLIEPDGSFFPVFNAADSAVCCGGVLLVLLALTGRELDGTRTPSRRSRGGDADSDGGSDSGPDGSPDRDSGRTDSGGGSEPSSSGGSSD